MTSLLSTVLERDPSPSRASRYTTLNGAMYLASGALLTAWPGALQLVGLAELFSGHEGDLVRVMGMMLAIIGWFYVIGGRTGARAFVAATVIDRLLVPLVLVPVALAGAFPRLFLAFAILDPVLALGAWALLRADARR